MTAKDAAFTLTLLHDPAYAGYEDITTAYIKGGKAYKEGKAKTIEGIRVLDDRTIQITTEKVSAKSLLLWAGRCCQKLTTGRNINSANWII